MLQAPRIFGLFDEEIGGPKTSRSKFQKHMSALMWKSMLQRQRRWRLLVAENIFALVVFLIAIVIGNPVFLTPLIDQPVPSLGFNDILNTMDKKTILGFAPEQAPYVQIMNRTGDLLGVGMLAAKNEKELNTLLYKTAQGNRISNKVTWILWRTQKNGVYRFKIRSTEVARYASSVGEGSSIQLKLYDNAHEMTHNPHLRAGFIAVQIAISHALLEHVAHPVKPDYQIDLVSMPISPLMEEERVRRAISLILMCYTIALLPPVLETEYLVVDETKRRFKRGLRIRGVEYLTMYLGWLTYALLTAMPICMLGSITLILIFRWIHLTYALITLLFYFLVMMMLALMMALAHQRAVISCIWTISQTLLQTFLAELMVHHEYDKKSDSVNFFLHMLLPPMGLINGLNQFALLQIGHSTTMMNSMEFTILSWIMLIVLYFMLLMLLQRTLGVAAIGGQVSWKTIIFKKSKDYTELHPVLKQSATAGIILQEVDELTAKAVSFRNVSKTIMDVPVLTNVTFDILRGEYSMLFSERIQEKLMVCVADLLTGLTYADSGSINVLGVELGPDANLMTNVMMMGYCDGSSFLLEDLTVIEHFNFYARICMWNQTDETVWEYTLVRINKLKAECDLDAVKHKRVQDLGIYYRAQLCWAIAMLLEPRVVVIPDIEESALYDAVIRDKIVKHKRYLSIIKFTRSSINVEHADRLFVFDNRVLAFGGSPAYMFFKFGREYRIRISCKTIEEEGTEELLERINAAGATVRAHIGSLLIIRMPTSPSSKMAELLEELEQNAKFYGVASTYLSLPDTEEVFRRAIHESRNAIAISDETRRRSKVGLIRLSGKRPWSRVKNIRLNLHLNYMAWKYFSFYVRYRFFFIMTIISALVTGASIGYDLATMLKSLNSTMQTNLKILTVEVLKKETTLVIQLDDSQTALSVADAYVLSQTGATKDQANRISYVAVPSPQSLVEFLVTQAIDSPQEYVHKHAYGIKVSRSGDTGPLLVSVLYSPIHQDHGSAARSLARTYMALMRHYSGQLRTSLEIEDDPLTLDSWSKRDEDPPLLIQFLLVLTISHMAMMPSKEHGLIRHMQKHAMNFSPLGYWLSLAFCDVIHYWILVILMISVAFVMLMFMVTDLHFFVYTDLVIVPLMLMIYGVGCVPQAYLFSLGPHAALNSMAFVIFNIVFGESTIVAKLFYGEAYEHAINFMAVSPQFNMAYALVKIKRTFLHNSACPIFKGNQLCDGKMLHKCCPKCGVLQECFKRESYLSAIMPEILGTVGAAMLFMITLQLWEYQYIQMVWRAFAARVWYNKPRLPSLLDSSHKEMMEVVEKEKQLKDKKKKPHLQNTFGEFLLAVNISRIENDSYIVRNVYLGLGKGESLALTGLKVHGRLALFEILSGYKTSDVGVVWAMSKFRNNISPHEYASNVAMSSDREPLPGWMSVYDALEMIAVLRGVPQSHALTEVQDYIDALDLYKQEHLLICRLHPGERKRLNFLAAVVGAPPILLFDECGAYQNFVVKRAMYHILRSLKKKGHAILNSGFDIESHLPVTNRVAIMRDGYLYELDYVDKLLSSSSDKGYIVVLHLKDEVEYIDYGSMFAKHFKSYSTNDVSDVLVNMQILDSMSLATIFKKMELLKQENEQVYSYIVCTNSIDYIYHRIVSEAEGIVPAEHILILPYLKKFFTGFHKKIEPERSKIDRLRQFENSYNLDTLQGLPWSVIFHR